ncbi:eukaryotic translation initiation factor 4 gamma 2 [Culicoides brevitarsis]|uniref:eukaryotic translation initiation factor 4 gamma 2 n=1 Tax=Culicoides brevitarsis TaxID=469753 RepID=UPI00307C4EC2
MYAQLCKRLSIEAPNFETNNDSCCTFLRLLVNNCRDKFENRAIHFENIINSSSVLTDDDEEKRNIAKAKMLGNVKFIGEIFKLGMLGETHLHKMLRSLLQKGSRQNPTLEERCDDLECLAQILKTCGKQLDASQGKNLMDQYFEHVERKIQTNSYYPARIRFLLRDVIELRNNNWIPRKIARTDGPVPMQDLNTDEDILRGGSAAYLHRQQRDQRNNERDSNHWMSKLPLNLQSTGFNDMFSSLSVAGGTSSLIPPFSPQQNSYNSRGNDLRDNSRHGGGHDSHRGGHRTYNNNNPRNHHHRGGNSGEDGGNNGHNNNYNPRYNKHNNHRDGHQNQNNSHNNSYGGGHHQNNQQQNNMLNNKDIAPRFKRTMMTPTTQTNTVDNLEMRPNQNSLLYKASQQSMKQQQQPLPLQPPSSNNSQNNSPYGGRNSNPEQSRGGHQNTNGHYNNQQQSPYGQNRNSNWNSNYNNHQNNGGNHKNPHGGQHSTHENNFQSSPFGNSGPTLGPNTLLGQTKNAVGKPMAVVAPTASTPINNILQKDTIPIKQAPEKASKKEKKDKGPGKEEFMKLVVAFVNDTLLKQEEESTESKLIEENGEIEENGVTEKKDVDEKEVVNNEDDDQELKKPKKSPGGNTIDDKCAAFLELKVPDKFMKDACIRILNEILDKDDATHDRVIEFLLAMRKPEHKLTNSALLEAFKNVINTMNEKEKTIPKITTIIASLLSRAVLVKLCKLSDIANYAENGQHYPLFLLVLQQLHKKLGKQPLQELFNASKVNLMSSLPEVDRTKDRMAEILEDRNLSFLYPLLRVQSDLWRQITTDPNPQAFYKYIKENIESCLYADPGFITAMTTVIVKFITKESSLAEGVDLTKLPDKAIVDKEKQLLEKYGPVLISFLHQKIDLQLIAIYALQVFCYSVNFPKGMLLRWFTALYELNIIDEDAFLQWKEDITDMYPGKGQALFQVNAYLTYLAEAESEEDEEDEA